MTTFEPCQQTLFDETECGPLMSSLAASPAKTYLMLASELASKVSDLVCGRSSLDLLARFDPASRSWKTCQASLVPGMDEFSETWPRSGMTLSGTAYPLPPSAPLTGGTGSGLLPTTEASNTKAVAMRSGGRPPRNFMQTWPTPRANDAEKRGQIDPTNARNGLPAAVKMWPTPTRHMHKEMGYPAEYGRNSIALGGAVKMFPTPAAGDDRDRGCMKMPVIQRRATLGKQLNLSMVVDPDSGSLNPDWVEWLMGFPIGWTLVPGWKNRKASPALPPASKTARRG